MVIKEIERKIKKALDKIEKEEPSKLLIYGFKSEEEIDFRFVVYDYHGNMLDIKMDQVIILREYSCGEKTVICQRTNVNKIVVEINHKESGNLLFDCCFKNRDKLINYNAIKSIEDIGIV